MTCNIMVMVYHLCPMIVVNFVIIHIQIEHLLRDTIKQCIKTFIHFNPHTHTYSLSLTGPVT